MAGPVFRELAEDLTQVWSPSLLYTGHPHTLRSAGSNGLAVEAAPPYDRRSKSRRLWSWMKYFFRAMQLTARHTGGALLFIVSNPPFLGLLGFLFKLVRGQRYVVLVYDIYPDLLVGLGTIRSGIMSRAWTLLNQLVLKHASQIFTIGEEMAYLLNRTYDLGRTAAGCAIVIPNWADVDGIRPLAKCDNRFAIEHGLVGRITVLYSGNMGNTHDIESILAVARELKDHETIRFLFIGEGAKWPLVEKTIADEDLGNTLLLPFQPEENIPYSMATGDIGIVAYQPGTESCMVPSKTYYYMAAGLVPLVISSRETDISRMLEGHHCGLSLRTGDIEGMKRAILSLAGDRELLSRYKAAARTTVERHFSRSNTKRFVEAFRQFGTMD